MRRRDILRWGSLTGLGLALGGHYVSAATTAKETAPKSASQFRFVALGDVGTGNIGQNAIAKVMNEYYRRQPFELVLLTGDNIYENGEISRVGATFSKPYHFLRKQEVPFYAVLGNHDIRTNNGVDQINFSSFNMQGRYYTFTQGIVQYFALDTNKNADWSQQLEWLEKTLASSTAPWKIVFGHHPLYSSSIHGSSPELIAKLTPLFSRYEVRLYINGHDHNYERTEPIEGTTYLTCGAGAKTRPVFRSDWTAHAAPRLSFATIDVHPERLQIQGIGKNGKVFDRGEIIAT